MRKSRFMPVAAAIGAAGLALAACSSDDDGSSNAGDLTIGVPAGWDEGVAVSNLWKVLLEDEGYNVELVDAEIGVIFTSLAGGSHDLLLDVWLPATHESYLDEYGDDIEELGSWYEGAALTIAVNSDSPVQSLADLAENADAYGNRLVGIDPGAGLTEITQDSVIPNYGLENMEFVISSTAAMLAELQGADNDGRDIAVTLWRPHWAYDAFDIRDLEDPDGVLGAAETIYSYSRTGFTDDHPEVAEWISNFTFSDDQLASLQNLMLNENQGEQNEESVREWLEENPDFRDAAITSTE